MPVAERDRLIAGLADGSVEVLASCEILGEGIDIPTISAAILLRPTRSLAVYLQQIGRGLRPAPGKSHLVVIDCAGNAIEHGLPSEDRAWTLADAPKKKFDADEVPGWICPNCDCLNPFSAEFCIDCGEPRPAGTRQLTVNAADEMIELKPLSEREIAQLTYHAFMSKRRTRRELEIYRRAHGYKAGWVWHAERHQTEAWK
jgi:superfamily II DNA or RNA helicase